MNKWDKAVEEGAIVAAEELRKRIDEDLLERILECAKILDEADVPERERSVMWWKEGEGLVMTTLDEYIEYKEKNL
jgi:hypothetical protein